MKKSISTTMLCACVGFGGVSYDQHNKLEQTKSELEKATQDLFCTKNELVQAVKEGESNYEILLREVVKTYFNERVRSYLGDENFYTRIMAPGIIGRKPTTKEFDIIRDEILNTIVPQSGLPLRDHLPQSPRHGYFYFGGAKWILKKFYFSMHYLFVFIQE